MMWQSLKDNIHQVYLAKGLLSMTFQFLGMSESKKLGFNVKTRLLVVIDNWTLIKQNSYEFYVACLFTRS